jgi:cytochrome c553
MNRTTMTAGLVVLAALLGSAQAAGDPVAGKEKSAMCQACHGPEGLGAVKGMQPVPPRIAGQYEDYLVKVLRDYKSGKRQNPIMKGMVAGLSDQDIDNLAAYYASLK